MTDYSKNYWRVNKDTINETRRIKYSQNLNEEKERKAKYRNFWGDRNKDKLKKNKIKYYNSQKLKIFNHYSNGKICCNCCGENEIGFLSLDHINGGGNEHRRKVGKRYYTWVIENNYPEGYQVLCYNCNLAKGFFGKCPHIATV